MGIMSHSIARPFDPVNPPKARHLKVLAAVCCLAISVAALAQDIRLIASGANRAIIEINGDRLVLTEENPVYGDVQLVSTNSEEVVLNYAGENFTLTTDSDSKLIYSETGGDQTASTEPVVIWADNRGFFMVDGKIDNRPIKFLVDTGADVVTLSSEQADRLGIDYSSGTDGYAATASGITALKTLRVNELSVGHLTQYDSVVSVIQGQFPDIPLLGSSFLNEFNMYRVGNRMEISRN